MTEQELEDLEKNILLEFDCEVDEDGDIVKAWNGEVVIDRAVYIAQNYIPKHSSVRILVLKDK